MPLTQTRALIAALATAMQVPSLPPDNNGGIQLTIGENTNVLLYGGDDITLLAVAPLGPLPLPPGAAVTTYLLRLNMFNSAIEPFRVGLDEGGGLILWARLTIADFTGETLANLVDALADRVADIRQQLYGGAQ